MLRAVFDGLGEGVSSIIINNTLMESFRIHARVPIELFMREGNDRARTFVRGGYTTSLTVAGRVNGISIQLKATPKNSRIDGGREAECCR